MRRLPLRFALLFALVAGCGNDGGSGGGGGGESEAVTLKLGVKPGPVPGENGAAQAPHLAVSLFARGLLNRVVTRIYFGDEPAANAVDPVLTLVDGPRRSTLIAAPAAGGYAIDFHLQGARETVFFRI